MEPKPENQRYVPREKGKDLLMDIARERGISLVPSAIGG
jgi:hypothetical protein